MFRLFAFIVAAGIVLVLVAYNTTYSVNYHEVAIVTRLGRSPTIQDQSGLHLKAPFFIDSVTKLDKRLQFVESPLETVLTRDGQQIMVQAFLFWRIDTEHNGPVEFAKNFPTMEDAKRNLETMLQGSIREVGGFNFTELIGRQSKLPEAEAAVLADLKRQPPAGVVPVQVGISRAVLPPKTTVAVQRRMASAQENMANLESGRANSEAEALKSKAASEADIIRNLTRVWGAEIESRGNREATRFYEQMQKEADLAIFLAWLDTLRTSLTGSSTFVTDMSRAPFHLLNPDAPTDASGIPLPAQDVGGRPLQPPAEPSEPTARPRADRGAP